MPSFFGEGRKAKRERLRKQRAEQYANALKATAASRLPSTPPAGVAVGTGPTGATATSAPFYMPPAYTTTPYYGPTSAVTIAKAIGAYDFPRPPELVEDKGLSIEPIVGLRSFYVDMETMELTSFNGVAWPHRQPLEAYCSSDLFATHDAPDEECQCGIYAWKPREDIDRTAGNIFGDVYLWGDVLICEEGYRAEMAYPKSLSIKAPKATRVMERLRDGLAVAYGVPVELRLGT